VKGRKRHIAVDVLGLVLKCHVSAANCADVKMAPWVLFWVMEQYERLAKILADKSYQGNLVTDIPAVYGVILGKVGQTHIVLYTFVGICKDWAKTLNKYWSSHPAFLRFARVPTLADFSWVMRLTAIWRMTAKFSAL
jgi:hypothetical protein